ncbi:hypothetical protein N9W34_06560 [Rickettsiales bacterium]|nr:hypothetical protein [Rickettsiales bacterium]
MSSGKTAYDKGMTEKKVENFAKSFWKNLKKNLPKEIKESDFEMACVSNAFVTCLCEITGYNFESSDFYDATAVFENPALSSYKESCYKDIIDPFMWYNYRKKIKAPDAPKGAYPIENLEDQFLEVLNYQPEVLTEKGWRDSCVRAMEDFPEYEEESLSMKGSYKENLSDLERLRAILIRKITDEENERLAREESEIELQGAYFSRKFPNIGGDILPTEEELEWCLQPEEEHIEPSLTSGTPRSLNDAQFPFGFGLGQTSYYGFDDGVEEEKTFAQILDEERVSQVHANIFGRQ